jgi:FMN phosphatase YigB (HAD superfamily)
MSKILLITDLDNTLYDWVSFFTPSFKGMIDELIALLDVREETLLDEFKAVHQHYGNSEQPFAVLELPSLKQKFPGSSRQEILERIDPALHRFNSTRKQTLALYEGVSETLAELQSLGVKIVGHTEAILANADWRMRSLSIEQFFSRLYTLEGRDTIHIGADSRWIDPPKRFCDGCAATGSKAKSPIAGGHLSKGRFGSRFCILRWR